VRDERDEVPLSCTLPSVHGCLCADPMGNPGGSLSRPSCNGYVGDPVSRKEVRQEAGIRDRNLVSVIWNLYDR
jgi:hypothetical protein